jgi:membrane-bound metal-dependent hydrolase YbcI (DUF457 family)
MNGRAHAIFGAGAGVAAGARVSCTANPQPTFPEICGWLAGGVTGAKLPDLFEPAIHPHHRGFAHSGTVLTANFAFLTSETLNGWIQSLKSAAAERRLKAQLNPQSALMHSIIAWLLEFLAGVLPSLFGGYASHLLCDATTPFGIPIC